MTNDNQLHGNPLEGEVNFRIMDMNSGSKVVRKLAPLQKLNMYHVTVFIPETLNHYCFFSGVMSCLSFEWCVSFTIIFYVLLHGRHLYLYLQC